MTTLPMSGPTTPVAVADSGAGGAIRRLIDRIYFPAEHPFVTLTGYYLLLVAAGALLLYLVPEARAMVSGERLAQLLKNGGLFDASAGASQLSWGTTLDMALAMAGAFLLMMPTSWVYMAERRRKGFDQSMVQTMIVLSVAIAGVVVIVRNSTALAFSLTGIVAAVRFRSTLSDTRDTLYIFTCIGVGLAAGVQALAAALVLSMFFNYITLLFWKGDYGMCELGRSPGHLLVGAPTCAPPANGKTPKKKAGKDFNAVVVIRTANTDQARPTVDALLADECRRFQLAEIESTAKGKGVLKYLIRIGKKTDPRALEDALLTRGAPQIIGVRVH